MKDKTPKDFFGIEIESYDCKHEEIFQDFKQVLNTGYFIDKRLFYPGDSFFNPRKQVEILALPVAGSWTRIKDAIAYAIEIKPKVCFPVHEEMLKYANTEHELPSFALAVYNIDFKSFTKSDEEEF